MPEHKRRTGPLNLEAEEFEAWRMQPTTVKVRRYLADAIARIRDAWGEGECWTEEFRYRVQDFSDIEELNFDSIEEFYAGEESDE